MPLNIGSTAGGSVTLTSGSTASATTLTLPAVNGTVLTTGTTLTVAQGGTGLTSSGTAGNILTSNGTTWASSAPAASVTALAAGTGISVSGSTGSVTVSNTGVTSAAAGTGISVSGSTGGVTFTNTGVTSLTAGSGISVSASTGSVTITNTQAAIPAGTNMLFFQASAPTGWTQYTSADNRALRVVSGTGGGGGGSIAFSTMFTGAYPVGSTAITEAEMPSHTHGVTDPGHSHIYGAVTAGSGAGAASGTDAPVVNISTGSSTTDITINATGGSQGHNHTIPALAYADVIICTKN
jgi:hypothetical protein